MHYKNLNLAKGHLISSHGGGVRCKYRKNKKIFEKNIFEKNIFEKNIFEKNIFEKNIFEKKLKKLKKIEKNCF